MFGHLLSSNTMTTVTTSTADLSSPLPAPTTISADSDSDWSPLASILSIIALIGIPTLIYTFFFAMKCPPNPFRSRRWSTGRPTGEPSPNFIHGDAMTTKKYVKEEPGGEECPVCLSVFVDGEELRQLKACNHAFHGGCIDKWLCSHSSCPVCRAAVSVERVARPVVDRDGDNDFRQGMPDSADMV